MFYPDNINTVLEFDKLIQIGQTFCHGQLGVNYFDQLTFHTELATLRRLLDEVNEALEAIERDQSIPLTAYFEITEAIKLLGVDNYQLDMEDILKLRIILHSTARLNAFAESSSNKLKMPLLTEHILSVAYSPIFLAKINQVIDDQGLVKSNASDELVRIRRAQQSKRIELERAFDKVAANFKDKGMLTDTVESFRNGRRVLSVPAEYKRQIPGIIHDESSTGKTVFIEPEGVILLNNDLFELEHEEIREIAKIIKALCKQLAEGREAFDVYQKLVGYIDFVNAKARLAMLYDGQNVGLDAKPGLHLLKCFHPLLKIKNNKEGRVTAPFDLILNEDQRILLISGPNAGGKSVLMKAVGLNQLLVQQGFLAPAYKESVYGIFENIFTDIGDRQSLEEDLSTYSSHLKSMKYFTDHVHNQTLILIDEFGSGTDPDVGGAIAESLLRYYNQQKAMGVVTTHYSILKLFAHDTEGLVNGSMLFDSKNLKPTYLFKAGSPGSSFAFELARSNKLPKDILHKAEQKLGSKKYKVDRLLNDLQSDKKAVEMQLKQLEDKQKKLDKLIQTYEQQSRDFEFKRLKLRQEIKEHKLQTLTAEAEWAEQRAKELSKESDLEKIKALAIKKRAERERIIAEMTDINQVIEHNTSPKEKFQIQQGAYVRLKNGASTGVVVELLKDKARVNIGDMIVVLPLDQLVAERQPEDLRRTKKTRIYLVSSPLSAKEKIDIRGLRRDEALIQVQDFIDQAIIANKTFVEILHGKGDGTLKQAVRQKLREYRQDFEISHPAPEHGGDGITIVALK